MSAKEFKVAESHPVNGVAIREAGTGKLKGYAYNYETADMFAAAPDLLDACKRVLEQISEGSSPDAGLLIDAIAKAGAP